MKKYLVIIFSGSILFCQTGIDIAKMIDQKSNPKDLKNRIKMVLTNSKGKTRTNVMLSMSKDNNKKQIIWFLDPRDDRGVAFLKIEHDDKDDEMRMWLPAFKKVRRISSKKKGDSFMGSDLSYEDLYRRDLSENNYNRLEDDFIYGKDCYVIEIIPKKEAKSSYSRHKSWVEKSSHLILKEESYDKRKELNKKKQFFFQAIKNYMVLERIQVKNVQKDHTTDVTFSEVKVDSGIDNTLFRQKNLKRIPKL
tara:strand:- start:9903 stop:10652 length:750 start_codon:yes stop_codon:yes gene_type:complete